jgi:hypothetical protein
MLIRAMSTEKIIRREKSIRQRHGDVGLKAENRLYNKVERRNARKALRA